MSNITIEIKAEGATELVNTIAELAKAIGGKTNGQALSGKKSKKVETQKPVENSNTKAETEELTKETAADEQTVTIEEIRAIVSIAAKKDRAAVKQLLTKYEAPNVTNLAKEHYDAFYKDAKELV